MTLEDFDGQMALAADKIRYGNGVVQEGVQLEYATIRRAGIEHTDREPGFPCWKVKGVEMRYCGSPREALEEAGRIRGLDMTVAEAREKRVCRICRKPIPVLKGTPKGAEEEFGRMEYPQKVAYNFGDEFAHTDCLPESKE
jgi:hypothetical protein